MNEFPEWEMNQNKKQIWWTLFLRSQSTVSLGYTLIVWKVSDTYFEFMIEAPGKNLPVLWDAPLNSSTPEEALCEAIDVALTFFGKPYLLLTHIQDNLEVENAD